MKENFSGDQVIDAYLDQVTSLWKEMEDYEKNFACYNYIEDTVTINGKYYIMAHMEDANKAVVTRGTVNWLFVQSITASTAIVIESTSAAASTASATAELPSLGVSGIKFAKYLKGGPMVIGKGMKEIKSMWQSTKANAKSWKSLKNGAIQDISTLNFFDSEALATLNKCYYVKEIVSTDPSYQVVESRQKSKSAAEIEAEATKIGKEVASQTVLPEDASKSLDNISDQDLNKELNS